MIGYELTTALSTITPNHILLGSRERIEKDDDNRSQPGMAIVMATRAAPASWRSLSQSNRPRSINVGNATKSAIIWVFQGSDAYQNTWLSAARNLAASKGLKATLSTMPLRRPDSMQGTARQLTGRRSIRIYFGACWT